MRPAFSVILLTTLIGAGQGLFLALFTVEVLARFGVLGSAPASDFFVNGTLVAATLTLAGLVASFFHLGRPERAWRTAAQWKTSWLSREVIVLPLFLGTLLLYALAHGMQSQRSTLIGAAATVACIALFVSTGMVYACIRFLQEWASPLTLVNFALLGAASGTTLAATLAARGFDALASGYAMAAIVLTTAGFATRVASLARNASLRPKSTLQSAIGVKHPHIEQKAQGFMGGSFNTREFFHGATAAKLRTVKLGFLALAFIVPIVLLAAGVLWQLPGSFAVAFVAQYAGLLAERWYFFAQANHPQNLYYQAMS